MRRSNSIIWGIVLIAVSLVLLLNAFEIANINLFFDGWWTFFIIIPCFAGLFNSSDRGSNLIGLVIGILLFLACRDIFAFDILWKLFVPAIIALMGIKMIYKGTFARRNANGFPVLEGNGNCGTSTFAAFSGRGLNYNNEVFQGAELTAIFGGIKCDLRNAIIENDVVINTCSLFGGIDILVADDVNVKVDSNSLFGGVDMKKHQNRYDNAHTIYLNSTCMFGGVDIK